MKPPIPLLISTVLVSSIIQPSAISQVRAEFPQSLPITITAGNCLRYFGYTLDREELWLHTCSLYPTRNGMEFTYQLDTRRVRGWTNCRVYGWWVSGHGYVPAASEATRNMVDFICE